MRERASARVCVSGGVFQNALLTGRVMRELDGSEVFLHAAVPCNDGGVALGHVVMAASVGRG